ncbi:uncharacterized protein [Haliotis cracherodii]|uniref:uncharacterized protein n=1 Tax=Haliotis cracherodii TaxID=6455 RepID=UPI0039ED0884
MDGKDENNHLEAISRAMYKFRDYVIHVMSFLMYRFTRSIIVTFQKFTWAVTGVERIRRDAKRGLQFKQSAHVQEIFWKRKFLPTTIADPNNFIALHKGFKNPNYVLKPFVSLYCMTKDEAVFVETPEGVNIYRDKKSRPLYEAQFEHATKMITMPLASFHKIASDVGDPRTRVVWLSSTDHCGSSLLAQVFSRVPGMMVILEPDAITKLGFLWKYDILKKGEYEQLLASAVRLLCKPDDRAGMICVKTRSCATRQVEDIVMLFPKIRQLFMYRNSLKTLVSSLNMLQIDPAAKAMRFVMDNDILSTIFPCFRSMMYNYYVRLNEKQIDTLRPSKMSTVGIFTAAWAAAVARVVENREKGFHIMPVLYEDIMKDPRRSCAILFDRLDIRKEALALALEAFKVDSQRSAVYGLMNTDTRRAIPQESRIEADTILKKYGLLKLGERFEIPGLIKLD